MPPKTPTKRIWIALLSWWTPVTASSSRSFPTRQWRNGYTLSVSPAATWREVDTKGCRERLAPTHTGTQLLLVRSYHWPDESEKAAGEVTHTFIQRINGLFCGPKHEHHQWSVVNNESCPPALLFPLFAVTDCLSPLFQVLMQRLWRRTCELLIYS
jgi:hypothetical protein